MSAEEAIQAKRTIVENSLKEKEFQLFQNGILLTEEQKTILNLPFTELLYRLKKDHLKAVDVLKAFQAKVRKNA